MTPGIYDEYFFRGPYSSDWIWNLADNISPRGEANRTRTCTSFTWHASYLSVDCWNPDARLFEGLIKAQRWAWDEAAKKKTARASTPRAVRGVNRGEKWLTGGSRRRADCDRRAPPRTKKQGDRHHPPDYRSPNSHKWEQGFSKKYRRATREASGRRIEEQGRHSEVGYRASASEGRCHAIPTEGASGQDGA